MAQEVVFSEETINKLKEIFHSLPVDTKYDAEVGKSLNEITSELKRIRQTLERRR